MRAHDVRCLLMGGQACVLYGGAEFSRDADLAVLAEPENLDRLRAALEDLHADVIAVPPFAADYLERGHAVHFRCQRSDVAGLRVDVMARMRGVDLFPALWERRTTLEIAGEPDAPPVRVDVLSLPDLVAAKKTQRDKDWPMIRRLVEANYFAFRDQPTPARVAFWLEELRTPELIAECVALHSEAASTTARAAVRSALAGDTAGVAAALLDEQEREGAADRVYWTPLKAELEQLRRAPRARDGK